MACKMTSTELSTNSEQESVFESGFTSDAVPFPLTKTVKQEAIYILEIK